LLVLPPARTRPVKDAEKSLKLFTEEKGTQPQLKFKRAIKISMTIDVLAMSHHTKVNLQVKV
jgi:hypothetical protein